MNITKEIINGLPIIELEDEKRKIRRNINQFLFMEGRLTATTNYRKYFCQINKA